MKINDQDIIRTARQLRDEENRQLNVRPWKRSKRLRLPAWLIAVPAAAVIGFLFGIWTQAASMSEAPLTSLVDTVYIKVNEARSPQDSAAQAIPAARPTVVSHSAVRPSMRPSTASTRTATSVGRPVAEDEIRYDLLVRN